MASSLYPIFALFSAYDSYAKLATKTGATTFNIGGVSIPLGTMLKRATAGEASLEEDTINFRLLTVQMWMIYWIVNGCVRVAESVLLLKYLPLYSLVRLCFSLWLVAPIALSSSRLKRSQVLSFADMQREWVDFSAQGCGLVYFRYLKPVIEGQLGYLSCLSIEPLLSAVGGKVVLPAALLIGMAVPAAGEQLASYMQALSGYSKLFASREVPVAKDNDLDEYDVVDLPRQPAPPADAAVPAAAGSADAAAAKASGRLWLW